MQAKNNLTGENILIYGTIETMKIRQTLHAICSFIAHASAQFFPLRYKSYNYKLIFVLFACSVHVCIQFYM